MSWRIAAVLLLLASVLPGTGRALDVTGSLGGSAEYDDNVARLGGGFTDDYVFRVTPEIELLEDEGKLRFGVDYRFPYEIAVKTRRLDGFRHFLNASGEYVFTERTRLYFRDNFSVAEAITNARSFDSSLAPEIAIGRDEVTRNRALLGLRHSFTPRTLGNVAFTYRYFDSDLPARSQANTFNLNLNSTHQLSPRHTLGGGVSGTLQLFAENNAGTRPPRQTIFTNFFASWTWFISETTTFGAQAGPTFITSKQDAPDNSASLPVVPAGISTTQTGGPGPFVVDLATCPVVNGQRLLANCLRADASGFTAAQITELDNLIDTQQRVSVSYPTGQNPGEIDDSNWDFFVNATLSHRWSRNLDSLLSYQRTDSTASGLGSAVLDYVSMITNWRLGENWTAGVRADFTRRQSTAPITDTLVTAEALDLSAVDPTLTPFLVATPGDLTSIQSAVSQIDTNRWGIQARLDRRLTRHLRVGLRYSYNKQTSEERTLGSLSDFDNHIITLGVSYDFDRYSLDRYFGL